VVVYEGSIIEIDGGICVIWIMGSKRRRKIHK
jgi:hypothetical protein